MALGDYMGASCHACIGGTNVRAEVQKLQLEAPHIIVGTPGRVFDMLNRRYLCEFLGPKNSPSGPRLPQIAPSGPNSLSKWLSSVPSLAPDVPQQPQTDPNVPKPPLNHLPLDQNVPKSPLNHLHLALNVPKRPQISLQTAPAPLLPPHCPQVTPDVTGASSCVPPASPCGPVGPQNVPLVPPRCPQLPS